ncbi:MAG: hypothetical protein Q4G34_01830 [Micrococcus sp.]|nr:hypothetical protein [Micrococcus sp.]
MSPSSPRPHQDPAADSARQTKRGGMKDTVTAPLIFSAVLGLVGGGIAAVTASGGTQNPLRVDIGLIAFGVFFVVSLVVVAMLQLSARENPDHLSQGSGVNRSSAELHKQRMEQRRQQDARQRTERPGPDAH